MVRLILVLQPIRARRFMPCRSGIRITSVRSSIQGQIVPSRSAGTARVSGVDYTMPYARTADLGLSADPRRASARLPNCRTDQPSYPSYELPSTHCYSALLGTRWESNAVRAFPHHAAIANRNTRCVSKHHSASYKQPWLFGLWPHSRDVGSPEKDEKGRKDI